MVTKKAVIASDYKERGNRSFVLKPPEIAVSSAKLMGRSPRNDAKKIWRLLDANANRAREGLRVVEDTARFIFENAPAARALRGLRHALDQVTRQHYQHLLTHRNVDSDPGRSNVSTIHRSGVEDLLAANFKRCGEALRVLEEYGRVLSPGAVSKIQKIRFEVYQWEKKLRN